LCFPKPTPIRGASGACQESRYRKGACHVQPRDVIKLAYICSVEEHSFDSDSQWRKMHYANLPLVITSQPPQASGISSIAHLNGRHEASQGTEQLEFPHPTNICACGIGVYLDVCIVCSEGKDACSDACSDGDSDGDSEREPV